MEETLVDNTPKIEEKLLGVSLDPLIPLESIMTDSLASGIHRNIIVSENRKYLSNCSRMREYIYNWLVFCHILTHSHINKLILSHKQHGLASTCLLDLSHQYQPICLLNNV